MPSPFLFPRHDHMDMDMDMGGGSSTGTGTGTGTGTSTGGEEMHTGGHSTVFQTAIGTALYSTAWTPSNTGTYAATCIFLIALAALFRGLLAFKSWQERRWLDAELDRRYVVVAGKTPLSETLASDERARKMTMVLAENGIEENVLVVRNHEAGAHSRPWRLSVDPARALVDTVVAGVGYLL